ncbi:unnamed protein product [Triticum turgidum subsp. durum]|uniref:Acidic protein n=1 Tax=Triticum turgidum subsp. durum TaxID=4567 RepID=A0A9R0W050_TRITD|nr:unnamed protein product [Triticum turgidum subsp. durum]
MASPKLFLLLISVIISMAITSTPAAAANGRIHLIMVNNCAESVRDREGRVAGCRSACLAMGSDKYCCTGEYGTPAACKPTMFSHLFKAICPRAYSYAFDDASSLNRCKANRYLITFCPPQPE